MSWHVVTFYDFVPVSDPKAVQAQVKNFARNHLMCGIFLIAPEGVNTTIACQDINKLEELITLLENTIHMGRKQVKFSTAEIKPFRRLKVRVKNEIVTLRQPEADPTQQVGTYVKAEDWNDLISDPDIILIDTRNTYETDMGMFEGAVDPRIDQFTDFPKYVEQHLDPSKNKKVAMFCTGGIRCEKASSYMLAKGFENVYHLDGGILKYLETVSSDESKWRGECFVFDGRTAVSHGLSEGKHSICYGCREPLSDADRALNSYEEGVSCRRCIDKTDEKKKKDLRQRHREWMAQIADNGHIL